MGMCSAGNISLGVVEERSNRRPQNKPSYGYESI
jgi:hypothetical protein